MTPWNFIVKSKVRILGVCLLGALTAATTMVVKAAKSLPSTLQSIQFSPSIVPGNVAVQFIFKNAVTQPRAFLMQDPTRLVLDFDQVQDTLPSVKQEVTQGVISSYIVVDSDDRTRVVLNLSQPVNYKILGTDGNILTVALAATEQQPAATKAATTATAVPAPVPVSPTNSVPAPVPATTSPIPATTNPITMGVVPASLTKPSIATEAVSNNAPANSNTPVLVPNPSIPGAPATLYSGNRISLNFQDIKIRAVLQLLAEFTGLNIVVSDSVQSSITLHLDNVPWDQALDIILQTQGLDKRRYGSVLLVAPAAEIAARERQDLQAIQQVQDLAPLKSELIQIYYGKAADIAALLQGNSTGGSSGGGTGGASTSLLSTRGAVSFDSRTNTIWVQDTPSRVERIRTLVKQLDKPVKQVAIAARIVNVNSNYLDELGVRFGVSNSRTMSGTLEGATALAGGTDPASVPVNQRLGVDLPAGGQTNLPGTVGGPASLGLAIAHLGPSVLLDLELSALESEGEGEIISTPRVVTADQQAAVIQSGEEIPYQQASSSGATNIAFQKAVLSLNVTPQVTPDGKIILTLAVNQDTAQFDKSVGGVPPIFTRSIQTQVLVNSGETIVLGGIYEENSTNTVTRVPFFGNLPLVGALFRQKVIRNDRTELLIFITPQILNQTPQNV